jgi:hypothetical protein
MSDPFAYSMTASSLASYLTGVLLSILKTTKDPISREVIMLQLISAHKRLPISISEETLKELEELKQSLNAAA